MATARNPTTAAEIRPLGPSRAVAVPARLPVSHLSHSSLALFWRCPERWRHRYVLREREAIGGAAVIGKAVGAALTAPLCQRHVRHR